MSGSTAPSFVVWPTWAEAPSFESGVITVGVTDPKKWTIQTNSTDTEFSIEHYLGTKLALSSDGGIKVNGAELATVPVNAFNYANGILIDLDTATVSKTFVIRIYGSGRGHGVPIDTEIQFTWTTSTSSFAYHYQINKGGALEAAKLISDNGRLKVWFPQLVSYQTFLIDCYAGAYKIQPASITDATEPTGNVKVTCALITSWTSQNFNPANYLPLSGGTMTGQLNMGSNNIVGSTSNCWITARRIGLMWPRTVHIRWMLDNRMRCNQVYVTKYHAGAGETPR